MTEDEKKILSALVVERSIDSFFFFARHVLDLDLLTEKTHKRWADDFQSSIFNNILRLMRLKPRGCYKTTLYGVAAVLWLWGCFTPELRIFYTSSNSLLLEEVSDKLSQYIGDDKGDTLYSQIFGITREIGPRIKNTSDVFNIRGRSGKGFSLILRTSGGSTVGIHPNIVFVDDPCFSGETLITTINGEIKIKDIKIGNLVLTRKGYKKVIWSGITGKNAFVRDYNLNGHILPCTPGHKIKTAEGNVRANNLRDESIITYGDDVWKLERLERRKLSISMESDTGDIQNQKTNLTEDILNRAGISTGKYPCFIGPYGYSTMERSLVVSMSTIKTVIMGIMIFPILIVSKGKNIIRNIQKNYSRTRSISKNIKNIFAKLDLSHRNGTSQERGEKNRKLFSRICQKLKKYVSLVNVNSMQHLYPLRELNFVRENAEWITTKDMGYHSIKGSLRREDVYNITVEDEHEFIANGVLVCNCDKNDRESQATRTGKEHWFDSLTPLLVPYNHEKTGVHFESIYYIGTRWHMKDLCNYIFDMNENKLPEALKWDIEVESILGPDGHTSYPEFFSDEKILGLRANMRDEFFSCQYCNQPLPESLMIFNIDKLKFVRPDQIDVHGAGEMLCVFDPSLGKTHSDYPAVWWIHFLNNQLTFYDAIDKKIELSLIVHHIAAKNLEYGCRHMIYEDNGILLVGQALKDAHARIGLKTYIEPVHHTSNKEERIASMQPDLYSGYAQFMSDYKERYPEAMNQIVFYPVYGHDDFPDCAQIGVEHFRKPQFRFIRYEQLL